MLPNSGKTAPLKYCYLEAVVSSSNSSEFKGIVVSCVVCITQYIRYIVHVFMAIMILILSHKLHIHNIKRNVAITITHDSSKHFITNNNRLITQPMPINIFGYRATI